MKSRYCNTRCVAEPISVGLALLSVETQRGAGSSRSNETRLVTDADCPPGAARPDLVKPVTDCTAGRSLKGCQGYVVVSRSMTCCAASSRGGSGESGSSCA